MTALERVRRARARLAATVGLAALLWAAAAAMGVITVAAAGDAIIPLPTLARAAVWPLTALAVLASAGTILWRGRAAGSLVRVALWIEERQPALQYALVTAIDPALASAHHYPDLHARARSANIDTMVGRTLRRTLGPALLTVLALAGALALLEPSELLRAASRELARRAAADPAAPLANRLESLSARIVPPTYSRLPATTEEDPSSVIALIGSGVTFGGPGPAEGVTAVLGEDSLAAGTADGAERWDIGVTMPEQPVVVAFHDRDYRRLVVLEPRPDSVPTLQLRLPANDTTYQTVPSGRLTIEASVVDDIGIDYGFVEYMLTAGGGENFDTRTTHGPRVGFENARTASLRDVIALDTLDLAPGTVLHIRAVASDYNDVTGPGKGVSETRTLRIADPVDSTSINPAPPLPIDSMWMSQRRLNMKTDTLIETRPELDQETFVGTSSGYGNAQEDIRQRAIAVIAILEDDGVGGRFETEISSMLREAVELMYTARVHLAITEPDSAMPHMIEVLAILDEIRLANRYYLRGLLRPSAVNIERVRHTGEDPASDTPREPRSELSDAHALLAERIDRAAALARTAPRAAIDSLTYIRVAALTAAPAVAGALAEAIERLERGADADRALARTRRALEPKPRRIGGPVDWGGVGH